MKVLKVNWIHRQAAQIFDWSKFRVNTRYNSMFVTIKHDFTMTGGGDNSWRGTNSEDFSQSICSVC